MKKACVKICLSFIVTLGSFIMLLVPASAGALTGVADMPTDNLAGHTATHAITFTLYSNLPKNGRIVIDFPGGFNVSGATLGANSYSILLYSIVGQEITLKKNTSSVSGGTALSLSLQNIINTQTPGNNYHLTVRTTDMNGDLIDGPTPSADFSILSGQIATLQVAGFPGVTSPGVSHNFTVTALDSGGNEATGYTGTVHFSSTDPAASLPGDHTFTAGDAGLHTFSAALNTAGIQSITATDISDGSITGTQSNLQVNIAVADTATAVESSDISSIYGDAVTFTANVSSQTGTPTGSVRFLDGTSQLGTAVLATGQATYTTPVTQLIAGNHVITAEYSGDSNYNASTSPAITQIVAARMLTVTAAGVNKVYDGTTAATVTLSDNRIGSDSFTKTYSSAVFVDKNAGTGKTVNVSGINVTGPDAGNYTWNTTVSTTANISRAQPVISWAKPADISYPTPLTVSQLNASANIAGQFAYSPPAGTILNVGNNQTLQANFTPQDSTNYSDAAASTTINVLGSTWKIVFVSGSQQLSPGAVSRPIAVQIQNSSGTPVNVSENTLISFSSTSATGKFDTSAAGKFDGSISSVSIAAGQNTASLYYKDASTGRPVITAASTGLIGASQQLQIKSPSGGGSGGGGGGGGSSGSTGEVNTPANAASVEVEGFTYGEVLELDQEGKAKRDVKLDTPDHRVSLKVPGGSKLLDSDNKPLKALKSRVIKDSGIPPAEGAALLVCEFGPEGANFDPPLTLTMVYDPGDLPEGLEAGSLFIATWHGSAWVPMDSLVDIASHTVSVPLTHFSLYMLTGKIAAPPAATEPGNLPEPIPQEKSGGAEIPGPEATPNPVPPPVAGVPGVEAPPLQGNAELETPAETGSAAISTTARNPASTFLLLIVYVLVFCLAIGLSAIFFIRRSRSL